MDQAALDKEITGDLAPALSNLKTFVINLEAKLANAPKTQPISTLDLSSEIAELHAFADAATALTAPPAADPVTTPVENTGDPTTDTSATTTVDAAAAVTTPEPETAAPTTETQPESAAAPEAAAPAEAPAS